MFRKTCKIDLSYRRQTFKTGRMFEMHQCEGGITVFLEVKTAVNGNTYVVICHQVNVSDVRPGDRRSQSVVC